MLGRMVAIPFILVMSIFLFFGCARVSGYFTSLTIEKFGPKDPKENILMTTQNITRPYREIGIIRVRANRKAERQGKIGDKMREVALQAGADAVIKIQCGTSSGIAGGFSSGTGGIASVRRTECQGIAVVFTDK